MTRHSFGFQFRYQTTDPAVARDVAYAYDGPELISDVPPDRVRIFDFTYYDRAPDDYHSPALRFSNLVGRVPANVVPTRLQNLEEITLNRIGHTAWHGETKETEVYFTCVLPLICTGFLDFKDLRVSASIIVSRQAVSDFWAIEKRMRSLLVDWETS